MGCPRLAGGWVLSLQCSPQHVSRRNSQMPSWTQGGRAHPGGTQKTPGVWAHGGRSWLSGRRRSQPPLMHMGWVTPGTSRPGLSGRRRRLFPADPRADVTNIQRVRSTPGSPCSLGEDEERGGVGQLCPGLGPGGQPGKRLEPPTAKAGGATQRLCPVRPPQSPQGAAAGTRAGAQGAGSDGAPGHGFPAAPGHQCLKQGGRC